MSLKLLITDHWIYWLNWFSDDKIKRQNDSVYSGRNVHNEPSEGKKCAQKLLVFFSENLSELNIIKSFDLKIIQGLNIKFIFQPF